MMSDRRTVLMAGAGVLAAAGGGAWPRAQVAAPAATTREIRIWPGAAPGGSKVSVKPTVIERSKDPAVRDRAWIGITDPTLTIYTPASPDGSAVLIMPGGAYQRVVIDKEGEDSARYLNGHGITAVVLPSAQGSRLKALGSVWLKARPAA